MNENDNRKSKLTEFRSSVLSSSSFIFDENPTREELKIKELLMKIQVLGKAVIEERNKNTEHEKEVNRLGGLIYGLESNVNQKENLIVSLSNEKFELHTRLDLEKQRNNEGTSAISNQFTNLLSGMFNKKEFVIEVNEHEFKKLQSDNMDLQLENAILKKKIEDQSLDFDKCKMEYQRMLNSQMDKLKKTENTMADKNKASDDLNRKLDIMFEKQKKFDMEKFKYEAQINDMIKEKKVLEDKIVETLFRVEEKDNVIQSYRDNLVRHEIESAELARKLAELKNAIIESNLVIQSFKCEKIGTLFNKDIEITFGRTDDDDYVMTIKEDENNVEYVNVEDIDFLKSNDKFIDMIDICYFKKGKSIKMSVLVPLQHIARMQTVFKDFLQKAIKTRNNLYY